MVKLYSSGCTRCKIIENLLKDLDINFDLVTDENIYNIIADENDIMFMPFAEIDGVIYDGKALQKYLQNIKEQKERMA